MSSVDYVKGIINNVELRMIKERMSLRRQGALHMFSDYTPELDATTRLESYGITMYQELIGELIWSIEI